MHRPGFVKARWKILFRAHSVKNFIILCVGRGLSDSTWKSCLIKYRTSMDLFTLNEIQPTLRKTVCLNLGIVRLVTESCFL